MRRTALPCRVHHGPGKFSSARFRHLLQLLNAAVVLLVEEVSREQEAMADVHNQAQERLRAMHGQEASSLGTDLAAARSLLEEQRSFAAELERQARSPAIFTPWTRGPSPQITVIMRACPLHSL